MKNYNWVLAFLALPIGLLIYNLHYTQDVCNYFETPVYHIINMFIAILFAFFLTQSLTDHRRKIDSLKTMIKSATVFLEDCRMHTFNVATREYAYGYARHKVLKEVLDFLEPYKIKYKFDDELEQAKKELSEWWRIFSDVMFVQALADRHGRKLSIHIANISINLEKIHIKICK